MTSVHSAPPRHPLDDPEGNLTWSLGQLLTCAVAAVTSSSTATFNVWMDAEISLGAAYDDRAHAMDRAQHRDDSGPALSSIRTGEQFLLGRLVAGPGRYETYRDAAVNEGIASSLTVPIQPVVGRRGALTYYADTVDAFTDLDIETAQRYAVVGGCLIGDAVALRQVRRSFAADGAAAAGR